MNETAQCYRLIKRCFCARACQGGGRCHGGLDALELYTQIQGGRRERGRGEGRRCAEGERARKLNGIMMNGWQMKESEEMSVRVDGGGEEESLSSEGDSGWKGKD